MAQKKIRTILYRRKQEQKTNYKKRLSYIISGKPRAVVRSSSNTIIVQIVDYAKTGDLTRVLVNSKALESYGWKWQDLPPGQKLLEPKPLFTKLDDSIVEEETKRIGT